MVLALNEYEDTHLIARFTKQNGTLNILFLSFCICVLSNWKHGNASVFPAAAVHLVDEIIYPYKINIICSFLFA